MSALEQVVPEGYKQTEVGLIPVDWDVFTLGELSELTSSKRIFESDYVNDGVPFYRGQEISSLLENKEIGNVIYISKRKYSELKARYGAPKPGEILITAVGTLGNALLIKSEEPFYFKDGNLIWVRKIKNCSPQYLINQLNYNKKRVLDCAIGSSQKALTMVSLSPLAFAIPESSKEQTAIANALSDVDALLTELEKLIAKKQAIKTATMQQLLTGKTRLPQFATYTEGTLEGKSQGQPKGTKPSELGEIPEDWGVRPIESVIKDLRGGAPFKPSDFTNAGVKVLPKGGVVRGGVLRIHEKDQQFCSKNWSLKYSKNCVDNRYTIVVLRDLVPSGPSIGLMVNIPTDEKYVLAQGVYGFIAEDEETSNYLIQYSNTTQYRKAANEIMVGSTQVHITNGAFKALKVPLPPKEERGAIATILSDMDNEIQTLEQRLAKTRQIKQGMMQALLTGRTRLPISKEAV